MAITKPFLPNYLTTIDMLKFHILCALLLIFLSSCATMNQSECSTADWQVIGYEDGRLGKDPLFFNKHRQACEKHGINADNTRYQQGYNKGLSTYCTPEKAYELGKYNQVIPGVCTGELLTRMQAAHKYGNDLFSEKQIIQLEMEGLNNNIKKMNQNITIYNNEIKEHQNYLKLANTALKNKNIPASERLIFYTQSAQLKKLIKEAQYNIDQINNDKKPLSQAINNLNQKINYLNQQTMPSLP